MRRVRWWWLPIAAALLAAGSAEVASPRVVGECADFVAVYDGDMPVLRYVRGKILAEGVPEDRRRGSYVHPLYSLDGRSLSDDFPEDHLHHRGLSWIWQKVTFDGVTKDLWTLRGIRQKYDWRQSVVDDDLGAVLKVANGWFEDSSGRRILDESVTFTVHPLRPEGRIIDCELRLSAIDTPVEIGVSQTGYSGFNLRFGPGRDTAIVTSKGPVTGDCDRFRCAWADLSGMFGESDEFDGVIAAPPDCAHCAVLVEAVNAGKDACVEKPMANRLQDAIAALDATRTNNSIVQVPRSAAAKDAGKPRRRWFSPASWAQSAGSRSRGMTAARDGNGVPPAAEPTSSRKKSPCSLNPARAT